MPFDAQGANGQQEHCQPWRQGTTASTDCH
jgi:hypothetical protein